MPDDNHLLVPIGVHALAIGQEVIDQSRASIRDRTRQSGDGRWSPWAYDYRHVVNGLRPAGPPPFFGATRDAPPGQTADRLVLSDDSEALPHNRDRGVYVHWVVPPGLRRARDADTMEFPALPDQWLIVRFLRRGAVTEAKAWFLDSGIDPGLADRVPNMLVNNHDRHAARSLGQAVPLSSFKEADFRGKARTKITAVGNAETRSATFAAFVAENRNVLSWHDDLLDDAGQMMDLNGAALSYAVFGWYHEQRNEPLGGMDGTTVMKALNWVLDAGIRPSNGDLSGHRCLFHGMSAYINYWDQSTHRGRILGYPMAPRMAGALGHDPEPFRVGLGNNAEDALCALVSSPFSGEPGKANLWKALEAILYRMPETLAGTWSTEPRDKAVHQSWFTTKEAGKIWELRPSEQPMPRQGQAGAPPLRPEPTPDQQKALNELNKRQAEVDGQARELVALQQDLYAKWWKLCEATRRDTDRFPYDEEDACEPFVDRVKALQRDLDSKIIQLNAVRLALATDLSKQTPPVLELRADAAPRFWAPADPVIVLQNSRNAENASDPPKYTETSALVCRLPDQCVTQVEIRLDGAPTATRRDAPNIGPIATLLNNLWFGGREAILRRMLTEASLVEQAVAQLAQGTVPRGHGRSSGFDTVPGWERWIENLDNAVNKTGEARDALRFAAADRREVAPHRLVRPWKRQPWSPLFIDWQVTWRPAPKSGSDFGQDWAFQEHDRAWRGNRAGPAARGYVLRGRSILSPIPDRVFREPVETLKQILTDRPDRSGDGKPMFSGVVRDVLARYQLTWEHPLTSLGQAGLMGQALTGFHETLLGRDITLPRIAPDPTNPWAGSKAEDAYKDPAIRPLLTPVGGDLPGLERLPPPRPAAEEGDPAFTPIRAGTLELNELWLVDDFGQWVDVLHGTTRGGSSGTVLHPRVRLGDASPLMVVPPRIVQPARLNFRFTDVGGGSPLGAVHGWVFYNPLDHGLTICRASGALAGELLVRGHQDGLSVDWDGADGGPETIGDSVMEAFARALIQPQPIARPRLLDLLSLIDRATARIRPGAARQEASLFGRPLALTGATLGLELFGKALIGPHDAGSANRPATTGDPVLDALNLPVNLGSVGDPEDGLIGYFAANRFDRIVTPPRPGEGAQGYLADPAADAVRIGFNGVETVTLLMDPWGTVQAACGILPTKSIALPRDALDKAVAGLEASFRVGPLLLDPAHPSLPVPSGDTGTWMFRDASGGATVSVGPLDPRLFPDQRPSAEEGRLILTHKPR